MAKREGITKQRKPCRIWRTTREPSWHAPPAQAMPHLAHPMQAEYHPPKHAQAERYIQIALIHATGTVNGA